MTAEQVLEKLVGYVENSVGLDYSVDSDPYKGIAFEHFKEAWAQRYVDKGTPRLTGDAMTDVFQMRKDKSWWDKYGRNWNQFCEPWHEWCWFAAHWHEDR